MSFFSPSFSASISQPKMRQEGFHLPSPTPSNGNPPSPPPAGSNAFDIFLPHHAGHQTHSAPHNAGGSSHFPNLALPDAFSRSGGSMDFGDELASLMASSPATSNERSTHTPPQGYDPHSANGADAYRPPHNIFDISAPATHFSHHTHGAQAFSLPHTSHRQDMTLSQPSSLHAPHPGIAHHHPAHQHQHQGLGRDGFTGHFNSTIPPLSSHHDPPVPTSSNHPQAYGQPSYTPTSAHPPRDTPSPSSTNRPGTGHGRSGSRSRSRAPAGSTGPTRTTKTKRRDSLSLSHSLAHAHLPSPPGGARPQAIVIPSHSHVNGRAGPVSPMNVVGTPGVGHTSGWFLPSQGGNPGSGPGEFSLPTPDSVGHGHAFGQFGTSVGSMGISPKDTNLSGKGDSPPADPVSKQAAIVSEKRRRRRESHNAVERRRRDNINEKISELATLIPEVMLDPSAPTSSGGATNGNVNPGEDVFSGITGDAPNGKKDSSAGSAAGDDDGKDGGAVKANKGMILRKSVDYIRYLQQLVNAQAARNRDLEAQLARTGVNSKSNGKGGDHLGTPVSQHGHDGPGGDGLDAGFGVGGEDDVLNLHSFSPEGDDPVSPVGGDYMGMNMNLGMGMGMHMKGMGMGFDHLEPMAESNEMEMDADVGMDQDDRRLHHQRRERTESHGHDEGEKADTSPSAASEDDGISARDTEDDHEQEERGRRGRDGRVRNGVNVKEETSHMEV